jgi:hypothetical protein
MDYPETFLRGIPNSSYVDADMKAQTHLFYFEKNDKRSDDLLELSINWEDDQSAIIELHTRRKTDGNLQFEYGSARIPTSAITYINGFPQIDGALSFERNIEIENPYHGNLLIPSNMPKHRKKAVAAAISLSVSEVIENLPEK